MSDKPERECVLWPTRENYARFKAVCDDDVADTFDEFEALAVRRIEQLEARGLVIERLDFDPDDMADWCRTNCGQVNATTRALYGAMLALSD